MLPRVQVRVVLRINNDISCSLAAIVTLNDTGASPDDPPTARFSRLAFVPGASVAHPAIAWDEQSRLYWMVSNVNRDALRPWDGSARAAPCGARMLCALCIQYSSVL
jgi:hypothetical protein